MAQGILHVPNYVISVYSYREKIEQLAERMKEISNRERREESQNLLSRLRYSLEQVGGIEKSWQDISKILPENLSCFAEVRSICMR